MPLLLITGPPNSGRTELLADLLAEKRSREPVLVVPSVSDIFAWERRLTADTGAATGLRIVHFRDLCAEILTLADVTRLPLAGPLRRRKLMAKAVASEWRAEAGRIDTQPGFVDALLELVDDFREAMIDPDTLGERIEEAGLGGLGRLEAVYRAYLEGLRDSGFTDSPQVATEAIASLPRAWPEGRPLLISGFDDMTGQQIELIRSLVVDADVDVTVTVTHEPGPPRSSEPENPATRFSNWMLSSLESLGDEVETRQLERGEVDGEVVGRLLDEVTRRLLRTLPDGTTPLVPGPELQIFDSSGLRNQAEALGAEVARLVSDGVEPGNIAIVTQSPSTEGRLTAEVLERYRIQTGLEAETAAGTTAVGAALAALLRATDDGTADDLIAWLRGPLGPDPASVDRLEFECRRYGERTAEGAARRLTGKGGIEPPGWSSLTNARKGRDQSAVPETIRRLADEMTAEILTGTGSWPPPAETVLEVRMAGAIAGATDEIEQVIPSPESQLRELRHAIEVGTIKVWSSPAVGAVTITSPYSIRGKRFEHVLISSVQEGGAFDRERPGPFLSRTDRNKLGMPPRTDPEEQERYLFYAALTAATRGVVISCMSADEAGNATRPSPLVALVEGLFEPKPERGGRKASSATFPLAAAPSPRELARTLAGSRQRAEWQEGVAADIGEGAGRRELEPAWLSELAAMPGALSRAIETESRTRSLGPLTGQALMDDLAGSRFGPTTVEAFAACPYQWYVQRAVSPEVLGPDSEPLKIGVAIHEVLQKLYERRQGERPETDTLADWLGLVRETVDQVFAEPRLALDGTDVLSRVRKMRVIRMVRDFLEASAGKQLGSFYPAHLEFGFGPIDMETPGGRTWGLAGRIDRIDLDRGEAGDQAIVIDYKSGGVTHLKRSDLQKTGKVQMPLYLHALAQGGQDSGLTPVAGIYISLRDGARRGAFAEQFVPVAGDWGLVSTDGKGDSLEAWIEEGLEIAGAAMEDLLSGRIQHDPNECRHHLDHPAVPGARDSGDDSYGRESE
jgi:ATP-dependent helicase/DNAse subunit B